MGDLDDEVHADEEPEDSSASDDEGDLVHLPSSTSIFFLHCHTLFT